MERIDHAIEYVSGQPWSRALDAARRWPPDLFALTSWPLLRSTAYCQIVSPTKDGPPFEQWLKDVDKTAARWAEVARVAGPAPRAGLGRLQETLSELRELCRAERDVSAFADPSALTNLLTLHAMADEACSGVGAGVDGGSSARLLFRLQATNLLIDRQTLSTFPVHRIKVLPKTRTPQSGLTLRSLSHHVAVDHSEVDIHWRRLEWGSASPRQVRIVVFPWPFVVRPQDFVPARHPHVQLDEKRFGFFDFSPPSDWTLVTRFSRMLSSAVNLYGPVDLVILPECAVTEREYEQLWNVAKQQRVGVLLAGVRGKRSNAAWMRTIYGPPEAVIQHKHHRWFLDEFQTRTYGLGHVLHPKRKWWECIDVKRRELHVLAFNEWLTMCHLICEDLARVDPVSHCLRALGPNLVVALLLDGPQLGARWPGRYATVLADDPGSSVLTVTCLGMATNSKPPGTNFPPSRVIALWKDSSLGYREISLDPGASGVLLTVWPESTEEFTADGRSDGNTADTLVLGEISQIP